VASPCETIAGISLKSMATGSAAAIGACTAVSSAGVAADDCRQMLQSGVAPRSSQWAWPASSSCGSSHNASSRTTATREEGFGIWISGHHRITPTLYHNTRKTRIPGPSLRSQFGAFAVISAPPAGIRRHSGKSHEPHHGPLIFPNSSYPQANAPHFAPAN
jgi:hypothetical protein